MTALDPQLIACAGDVGYELKMIGALGQLKTPTDLPFVGYGLLESLLLHVRMLDDFLAGGRQRGPDGDDLTARDYNSSWPNRGFLKKDERSAINKKLAHLTRSRQDHEVDQRWRSTGALDTDGNWHRRQLAERALAASTRFVETLDPGTKELFYPALTEAWKYHLSALEVIGQVRSPQSEINAMVVNNRVTVWVGTGHIVVQDMDGDP